MPTPYTVMIVDDSPEDRYLLKRQLKKTNLELVVLEVSNGNEGVELLTTPPSELAVSHPGISGPITIFLDINMPLMNGWEFIEALDLHTQDIKLKPTVVLMYSTSDDAADKDKALQYDAVAHYIVKGESTPDVLREAILAHH